LRRGGGCFVLLYMGKRKSPKMVRCRGAGNGQVIVRVSGGRGGRGVGGSVGGRAIAVRRWVAAGQEQTHWSLEKVECGGQPRIGILGL